jgi:hypothetical protein
MTLTCICTSVEIHPEFCRFNFIPEPAGKRYSEGVLHNSFAVTGTDPGAFVAGRTYEVSLSPTA